VKTKSLTMLAEHKATGEWEEAAVDVAIRICERFRILVPAWRVDR
jgi:hypothetical protein